MSESRRPDHRIEWITLAAILVCYGLWGLAMFRLAAVAPVTAILVIGVLIAFHASLTHEVLHGHPFRDRRWNEVTMLLPLNLCIPYRRFRDLHLAHHREPILTDPYDDPESNYLDPAVWAAMPRWRRWLLRLNNTLLGRILLGPALGQARFFHDELQALRAGGGAVWLAWGLHLPGAAAVLALVAVSPMPVWAYLTAAYLGLGLLKIRTFLEHRAHEDARARTVIIEDRGPLALLFLNNNLHVVHHMHPTAPWYRLPALYRARKAQYLARNLGYAYRSYGQIFRRHFWRAKDPVPHPLWPEG
ncbi:fatty acid desaturase [Sedimentitalea sp. HM32M-2]|uniref:fatty acid desaturase n=1 Tax=Sedimentitalea sp. HM32M-2 TaxID=3351566 RepID=UPI00363765A0